MDNLVCKFGAPSFSMTLGTALTLVRLQSAGQYRMFAFFWQT